MALPLIVGISGASGAIYGVRLLKVLRDILVADQIQGAAFSGEKKYSESLAALKNVYDAAPRAVQPMVSMVATYLRANQPDKANALLEAALKKNPDNAEALVLMGTLRIVGKSRKKRQPTSSRQLRSNRNTPLVTGCLRTFMPAKESLMRRS